MRYCIMILLVVLLFLNCGGKQVILRDIPRNRQKSLAVLKFKNQSSSSEYNPWEMGLSSMLMTDLLKIGVFKIVSRERMKEILKEQQLGLTGIVDTTTAQEIGKVLGAEYILMGTFIEFKGTLRIEAQIFHVEKGTMVKADEITGNTERFFELEKELVYAISQNLEIALSEGEKKQLAKAIETRSVKASLENYDGIEKIEKAQELEKAGKNKEAEKLKKQAKSKFKKALEYDPEYEEAKENLDKLGLAVPISF